MYILGARFSVTTICPNEYKCNFLKFGYQTKSKSINVIGFITNKWTNDVQNDRRDGTMLRNDRVARIAWATGFVIPVVVFFLPRIYRWIKEAKHIKWMQYSWKLSPINDVENGFCFKISPSVVILVTRNEICNTSLNNNVMGDKEFYQLSSARFHLINGTNGTTKNKTKKPKM